MLSCFQEEKATRSESLKFSEIGSGRAGKKGAIQVSFTNYESPGGILVQRRIEQYRSSGRAKEAMKAIEKQASQIIAREARVDGLGKALGEKLVLRRGSSNQSGTKFQVVWSQGTSVYVIESSSLRHVTEFYRQVYGQQTARSGG